MAFTGDKTYTPETLNLEYERVGDIWNRLEYLPEQNIVDIVNDAFTAWQDWFWGNYEYWELSEIPVWEHRFIILEKLIDEASKQTKILDEPVTSDPLKPGVITHLPPEYVYGRIPEVKPAGMNKGLMWGIIGILGTILLSKTA